MAKPKVQVLICTNHRDEDARRPCCGEQGAAVARRFKEEIRARGLRDDVMVVKSGCLKHCSRGPVVAIWPCNLWYRGVRPEDVGEIVDRSVVGAEEIERLVMPDIPWE